MTRTPLLAALAALLASSASAQFQLATPSARGPVATSSTIVGLAPSASAPTGGFLGSATCAAPTLLPSGPTAFPIPIDTSVPSPASPANPLESLCNFFGATEIADAQWFSWTATSTGVARLSTCGSPTPVDTKIAVYADDCANLALLHPLACKDDTPRCTGLSTVLTWNVVTGESYLLQLGNSPTGIGGPTEFTIEELPARPAGQHDLGASDNALGLVSGGEIMWLQTFDAGPGLLVTAIETAFGTPNTFSPPDGQPCRVAVYAGTPALGLTLLASESGVTSQTATDQLVRFTLGAPTSVSGEYTLAVTAQVAAAEAVAALDQTVNSMGRAWIAAEPGGTLDLGDPAAASVPPAELQSLQPGSFDGVFLLRAVTLGSGGPFVSSCNGDGGDQLGCTSCPCANDAAPGTIGGCLNSAATSARLVGSGTASVAAGDLRFEATDAPAGSFAVLTSGAALAPTNASNPCFGLASGLRSAYLDGLRCAVQSTLRHGGRAAASDGSFGLASPGWGPPDGPLATSGGIAAQGGFVPGQTRHFQLFYRDFTTASCSAGLNTTQAVTVVFAP